MKFNQKSVRRIESDNHLGRESSEQAPWVGMRHTQKTSKVSGWSTGNGSPLQCSCLENPRDGGAWWAAVYGVTQSRTRLKRLSSSSSSTNTPWDFSQETGLSIQTVTERKKKIVLLVIPTGAISLSFPFVDAQ